ncbi:carotenoid 1,2-hydratase [Legionella sp. km772]|uniref:carotenoid 1,2-hydratase n=1 Tax=Legionella sp. km772 TaxID=2498111 RepID=UPI0013153BCF|nr:carotenoid 1,2-hydratase [Legionella sp. km772]
MNKIITKLLFIFFLLISFLAKSSPLNLSFPIDHGRHSNAELEWWNFFGHLVDSNNHVFGFTLNFIRTGVPPQQPPSLWITEDIYTSYFTITDGENKQFYTQEKMNRTSFNFAGASTTQLSIWNRDWTSFMDLSTLFLQAETKEATLKLRLALAKPPLLFGQNGFFDSLNLYYYALPNLQGEGELRLGEQSYRIISVKGGMDHAFQMKNNSDLLWDKFVIQLNNGDDIFLYILSSKNSTFISPESFCIINYADSKSVFLKLADFQFSKLNSWYSETTKINYPSGWSLNIPSANYHLEITPILKNQEIIAMNDIYWQGQSFIIGDKDNTAVKGYAYVELSKKINRDYIL